MTQFYFKTLQADQGAKAVEVTKHPQFSLHPDIPNPAGVENPQVIDLQPVREVVNRILVGTENQPVVVITRESLVALLAMTYLQGRGDGAVTNAAGN